MGKTLLEKFEIKNKALDLSELQGTPEEIALAKIIAAHKKFPKGIVLCEDVSLFFNAWKQLPGPYM
jgi:inosine triphosphate pyrophosphatase